MPRQNVVVTECRRLDGCGIELLRLAPVFGTINVVAGNICVGVRRPNQIDEALLPGSAGDCLQSGGRCGREYVLSQDGDGLALVPLDLLRRSLRLLNKGNDSNSVLVRLSPFDAVIYKAGSRIGTQRNFSGHGLSIRACFLAIEAVNEQ